VSRKLSISCRLFNYCYMAIHNSLMILCISVVSVVIFICFFVASVALGLNLGPYACEASSGPLSYFPNPQCISLSAVLFFILYFFSSTNFGFDHRF
jgi:hypothetical protein